jgi:hypothetical protein
LTPEQANVVRASREAMKSNPLWLQGITTCASQHLKIYMPDIADELRDRDPATGTPYICFNFNAPYDDPHNHLVIMKIVQFVRMNGAQHVLAAAPYIDAISEADLLTQVQAKFRLMRKDWKARERLVVMAIEATEAAEKVAASAADGTLEQWTNEEVMPAKATKKMRTGALAAKLQSRAIGVSAVRFLKVFK